MTQQGAQRSQFQARILPLILMLLVLVGAVGVLPAMAAEERMPSPQQLAPGVYAVVNQHAEATAENRGAVGNQGILIGDKGVIVVDTGTSVRYAAELLAAVRRLTSKPIVLVINTHQHPAFIFGNGALALQGVPILAHRAAAELIEQRCDKCLKNLNDILGKDEMQGTQVVAPTRIIEGPASLKVAGRWLDIVYYGRSSSPGSIGVIDRASKVLFAGGLVSIDRVPDTRDAQIETWLRALQALKRQPLRVVVPGEGPVAPVARLEELERYLTALQSTVEKTYQQGVSLGEAGARSELPEFKNWLAYHSVHSRNVEHLYLQLEQAAFDKR
ncbi:MBL fold metallo-hydrolase [Polaromonas sp.]|uniref:MBL fold metallo-hydrolase n=1 Tax=Polaromonas sp. TaxID=1869339 RepID=UPI0017FD5190|nr:MBL fold metallo-hydrolase [Polaromonas sp.]NMM04729.1 MBL fold metallo-hydrolase [Polaromonas sp.]